MSALAGIQSCMADTLRQQLLNQLAQLLEGGQAHATLEKATDRMPFAEQGVVPAGLPYSAWQLLEHIRIAQHDILDFSRNQDGGYRAPAWPKDYWPASAVPPDESAWRRSVAAIQTDRAAFLELLREGELTAPFPWGDGQNLLREAFLIADHTAYHTGELIAVRRMLGCWEGSA